MAKMTCPCGEIITTSGPIPNPAEWLLISDNEYDRLSGTIDIETLYRGMVHAFRCPRSGHLFIFWAGMEQPPNIYEPLTPSSPVVDTS